MRSEIKSDNLILRKYKISFAPLLFEAAMESRGDEFSRWMPWCHENYAIKETKSYIQKVIENRQNETEFGFAIFDASNSQFLGDVSLNAFNSNHKFYNLGYWIRISQQNRGIASAATRILARTGFEDLPINRIEILTAIENIASQKAAEKAGATREGVLRNRLLIGGRIHDAAMFSFIRKDF